MSPTYAYRCPRCDEDVPVTKSMEQATEPEPCPICRRPMARVFDPTPSRVKGGTPSYHRTR